MSDKKTTSIRIAADSQTIKHLKTELAKQSQTTAHLQNALGSKQPANSAPAQSTPQQTTSSPKKP